jgi:chromosome segregation ATPase
MLDVNDLTEMRKMFATAHLTITGAFDEKLKEISEAEERLAASKAVASTVDEAQALKASAERALAEVEAVRAQKMEEVQSAMASLAGQREDIANAQQKLMAYQTLLDEEAAKHQANVAAHETERESFTAFMESTKVTLEAREAALAQGEARLTARLEAIRSL